MPERKLTGTESSLFDFSEQVEKLWCDWCHDTFEVVEDDGFHFLLSCGDTTTRELSVSLEKEYKWSMECGWPDPDGGWYDMEKYGYPGPDEMAARVVTRPGILRKIRERMGKNWTVEKRN